MQVDPNDAEAGFFDQAPQGVRRETHVQELNVANSAAVEKLKSDTICVFMAEIVLIVSVFVVILADDYVPPDVKGYLISVTVITAFFAFAKLALFYCLAYTRPAGRTEWYQIGVQFFQGLANTILYFLTINVWDGVQDWFWNESDDGWFANITKIMLGLLQYYWLFLFSCFLIILVITVGIMICSCSFRPPQDNDGSRAQPSGLERQETSNNLGQMSRLFDFSKFSEHEECSICLMPFTSDCMVTPLPCDKRHYFHS